MPHNNRMSTSGSLKSSAVWQNTIGHDPYAGQNEGKDDKGAGRKGKTTQEEGEDGDEGKEEEESERYRKSVCGETFVH